MKQSTKDDETKRVLNLFFKKIKEIHRYLRLARQNHKRGGVTKHHGGGRKYRLN